MRAYNKSEGGSTGKAISLLTPKQTVCGTGKTLSVLKTKKQNE